MPKQVELPPHPGYLTIVFKGDPETISKIIEAVRSDAVPGEITGMAHSDEMTRLDVIGEIMNDNSLDSYDKMDAYEDVAHADDPQAAYAAWKDEANVKAA